jgi:uncharacterized membrane protein
MMLCLELLAAFVLGGSAYGAIEILWRGHTHWTMLLAGGLCFALLYVVAVRLALPRWQQYLLCAGIITAVELCTGLLVNRVLGWNVWDYSHMRFNLWGQVCARYCLYGLLLSRPGCALARRLAVLFRGGG